jgi:hypothetical protein
MSKLKSLEELFGGRHFDREIIIRCVRLERFCRINAVK